ncbi:MAG: hypothetical protein HYV27_05680 [Candidatus Hydrogenedentes bacterium]|nr:hypothetical protein [Candidatus Hydrogenedentota bacterium]
MSSKHSDSTVSRSGAIALRREQELCVAAVTSGEYDDMSDAEWVLLCEQLAQEAAGSHAEETAVVSS